MTPKVDGKGARMFDLMKNELEQRLLPEGFLCVMEQRTATRNWHVPCSQDLVKLTFGKGSPLPLRCRQLNATAQR